MIDSGGGDGFLFLGPKVTPAISSRIAFGANAYEFTLRPTAGGSLQIAEETVVYKDSSRQIGTGSLESSLKARRGEQSDLYPGYAGIAQHVYKSVSSWTVYHFHDTSPLSPMRRDQPIQDTARFRHDASNIAPFLLNLKDDEPGCYELIRDTVRLIAPFFDDFLLRPQKKGASEQVRLEWQQKGSDFPFQPNQLSDGTIRFICLVASLLSLIRRQR